MATGQRIGRAEPDARRAIDHRTGSATTTQERREQSRCRSEKAVSTKRGFPSFIRATSQGRLSVMLGDETASYWEFSRSVPVYPREGSNSWGQFCCDRVAREGKKSHVCVWRSESSLHTEFVTPGPPVLIRLSGPLAVVTCASPLQCELHSRLQSPQVAPSRLSKKPPP